MENSDSTTADTGWQPHHLLVRTLDNNNDTNTNTDVIAVVPLFIKTHSYGEYVFDWAWADAYSRNGMDYYPKLLNAIPFTPATGKRWGIDNAIEQNKDSLSQIITLIANAIRDEAIRLNASSCHSLFVSKENSKHLDGTQWQERVGYQYHWFNKNYKSFDDYLSTMASRKRKNINKERSKILEQNILLSVKSGDEISAEDWDNFYLFYQTTYMKRSGHGGYLSPTFFPLLAQKMSQHIVMVQAYTESQDHHNNVAAALFFKDSKTLYGRYWGCKESFDGLHFEACYYQGIEYAIQNNLERFDPGAQGEHKIQRGFTPIKTYSRHWIAQPEFSHAIARFLTEEKKEVNQHIIDASQLLPFKQNV